ncbi:MAG: type II toxin-antitoxin system RelE/ParE family toxin [Caulobacteraceae bacterium]
MIQGWKDERAKAVFEGRNPGKGFPGDLIGPARRRLAQLNAAVTVEDMRTPPGNALHRLTDDRAGQWSVKVNDQFRICFVWGAKGPDAVEFVDYH